MKKYLNLIENILTEATYDYDKNKLQPALMTRNEYLSHRNPAHKSHPDDSYNMDIASMNRNYSMNLKRQGGAMILGSTKYEVYTNEKNDREFIGVVKDANESDTVYAFSNDGVLYYDPMTISKKDASMLLNADYHDLELQPVKYIKNQYEQIFIKSRLEEFDKFLKRINIDGEYIQIRQDTSDRGDIAAFNEEGMIVAVGQDEWGAVLISVAEEYKGKGIGPIMQKIYTELYPEKESGGFTPSGLNNAVKVWEKEVRNFLAAGIYSNLIRKGEISKERVQDIVDGLSGKVDYQSLLPKKIPQKEKDYLIYYNGANSFILYDKDYLLDHDMKYIYAYIHFETKPTTDDDELYVYRFEYESDKDRQTIFYIAIQQLQSEGIKIKEDEPGSDYFKYDDMKYIDVDEGYFNLTKGVFSNLNLLYSKERQLRNQIDKYNEVLYNLLEDAERKWR